MNYIKLISCAVLLLLLISCGEEKSAPRSDKEQSLKPANTALEATDDEGDGTDWPNFMYDISYSGLSSDTILHPPLSLVWKFKTGGPVNSSPVVVDDIVYIGSDDGKLYALNARKWNVIWEFEAGQRIIFSPTVYDGMVYFSARDNKLYALDAATGDKKWDFQADGWINAPVVAFRQRIYFGCYENKIYTLDAYTGSEKALKYSTISIGNQRYTCADGEFYPMDARQRASRWRRDIPPSESWPVRANGFVYIGARDSKIRAFDYKHRREVWNFRADGWIDTAPAVSDGMIYFGSRDGYVYAFANTEEEPQEDKDEPDQQKGVITRDGVVAYDRLDEDAKRIALLNEGATYSMTGLEKDNWRQAILPDGQKVWISALDFVGIRWEKFLQVNDSLAKTVTAVDLPKQAEEVSWSPDGMRLAFFDNISIQNIYWRAKSIWLADKDGSDPVWVADGSFYNPEISWSRTGDWLAMENVAGTDREIWTVRTNGTGLRKTADGEAPALSPRGGRVAFIRRDRTSREIWVRELRNGEEQKVLEVSVQGGKLRAAYSYVPILDPPVWSPGGSRLAAGMDGYHYEDRYSRVVVFSASSGLVREMAVRAERVRDIAWSPDGSHIAYVTQGHTNKPISGRLDRTVHVTDLNSRDREAVFENSEGIAWSPDGRHLAFISENECMGMRRKVWLLDIERHQLRQLLASKERIYKVFWLADGRIALLASSAPSENGSRARGWLVSMAGLPG